MSQKPFDKSNDIRPARGVRLENNKQKPKDLRTQPQIIQDVSNSQEELPPPTEDAAKLIAELALNKQELVFLMKEFNKLLSIKTLPENKTTIEKENEQNVVNNLVQATLNVERLSNKEGLLALCILSLRQSIALRDAGNEMAFKFSKLEERINALESKKTDVPEVKKIDVVEKTEKQEPKPIDYGEIKQQMLEFGNLLKKLAGANE
jgi:hypothetical protein